MSAVFSFLATTSRRAFLRLSACARPRPSATASAIFANNTVAHRMTAIVSTYHGASSCMPANPRKYRTVTKIAPIYTTNMTGFLTCVRGASFLNDWANASRPID